MPPARLWVNYAPIHHLSRAQVFSVIAAAGQRPHPAYFTGNERLSCKFCIMGSPGDLRNAALHDPELYQEYLDVERETGSTFKYDMKKRRGKSLQEIVGFSPDEARARRRVLPVLQGAFTPSQIPSEAGTAPEGFEGVSCGGGEEDDDEWAEEEGEAAAPKANGVVCAGHAYLERRPARTARRGRR